MLQGIAKSNLRDRYEDIIDEVIRQYAEAEGIQVNMPKLVRRHQYKNYRISHSENKNTHGLGDSQKVRKNRLRHLTQQN